MYPDIVDAGYYSISNRVHYYERKLNRTKKTLLGIINALSPVSLVAGLTSRNLQITIASLIMSLVIMSFVTAFKISAGS